MSAIIFWVIINISHFVRRFKQSHRERNHAQKCHRNPEMCTKITTLKSTFCQNTFFQCTIHMHSSSVKQNLNFQENDYLPPSLPHTEPLRWDTTHFNIYQFTWSTQYKFFIGKSVFKSSRIQSSKKNLQKSEKKTLTSRSHTNKIGFSFQRGRGKIISERKQHNTVRYDWGKCAFNFVTNWGAQNANLSMTILAQGDIVFKSSNKFQNQKKTRTTLHSYLIRGNSSKKF